MKLILNDDDMLPECGVLGPGSPAVVSLQLHPQGHVGAVGQSVDELVPVPELPRQVSESVFIILIDTLINKVENTWLALYLPGSGEVYLRLQCQIKDSSLLDNLDK